MQISVRTSGGVTILDVADRLTVETTDTRRLTSEVRRLLQEGHRRILVNLAAVRQIDSSGLAELVEAFTTTARNGGTLKLVSVTRSVDALLRITQLARVFEIFAIESEAVASF